MPLSVLHHVMSVSVCTLVPRELHECSTFMKNSYCRNYKTILQAIIDGYIFGNIVIMSWKLNGNIVTEFPFFYNKSRVNCKLKTSLPIELTFKIAFVIGSKLFVLFSHFKYIHFLCFFSFLINFFPNE